MHDRVRLFCPAWLGQAIQATVCLQHRGTDWRSWTCASPRFIPPTPVPHGALPLWGSIEPAHGQADRDSVYLAHTDALRCADDGTERDKRARMICMRGCRLVVQRGLAHVCAGAAWSCSVLNAGQTSKIESSKNNQASACMRSAEHWRRWKQPAPGKASTDVCSAGQVQFARAGSRVLNRKTLAGRDRDLDAVRRVVVFSVVAA